MELHISETGPTDAPTIVFLHGGGGAGWNWAPQVEALAPHYHCLVPDLPEQGRSLAVGPFTMADATARLSDLIRRRAHGGRAHVVGLSLGAQLTVNMLSQAPALFQRAIVSSALLRPLPFAGLYKASVLAASFRWGVAPLQNSRWYARLNMRHAAGIPERYFPQFWEDYQRLTADAFARVAAEGMAFRSPAGLENAQVPVLVVVGRKEYAPMHASARDLLAVLPDARGVVVDVGRSLAENHNWNLNAPDLFTRMVRAWLTEQPLPAELTPLPSRR